jgi:putative restriction endonuclease
VLLRLYRRLCGHTYGELGEDFIEGHHTKPLSDLVGVVETKVAEIALACSNCHRMLHWRPDMAVEELRFLVNKSIRHRTRT